MNERVTNDDFYRRAANSQAFASFCTDVFGLNTAQDGFTDRQQIDYLLNYVHFNNRDNALQLGCGNGKVSEYISVQTDARVTGIDQSGQAIANAKKLCKGKTNYIVADAAIANIPRNEYSAIFLIDAELSRTYMREHLESIHDSLMPGGRLGIFYTEHIRDPRYQKHRLAVTETQIAHIIRANGWNSKAVDFCDQHYALLQRKRTACEKYRKELETEDNSMLYETVSGSLLPGEMTRKEFERRATRSLYCIYK